MLLAQFVVLLPWPDTCRSTPPGFVSAHRGTMTTRTSNASSQVPDTTAAGAHFEFLVRLTHTSPVIGLILARPAICLPGSPVAMFPVRCRPVRIFVTIFSTLTRAKTCSLSETPTCSSYIKRCCALFETRRPTFPLFITEMDRGLRVTSMQLMMSAAYDCPGASRRRRRLAR
jgi:hypothetical protein